MSTCTPCALPMLRVLAGVRTNPMASNSSSRPSSSGIVIFGGLLFLFGPEVVLVVAVVGAVVLGMGKGLL